MARKVPTTLTKPKRRSRFKKDIDEDLLSKGEVKHAVVRAIMLGVGSMLSTTTNDHYFAQSQILEASIQLLTQAQQERQEAENVMRSAYGNNAVEKSK